MTEIWKDIVNYEGIYKISSYGNILSNASGTWISKKARVNRDYLIVNLHKNGKSKSCKVHRLVAINFLPNLKNDPYVNHKDGNKLNNMVGNLEWVTAKENSIHASKLQLLPCGSKNSSAKLTEKDIIEIRKFYDSGEFTQNELSYLFNINQGVIGKIVNCKLWKHVKHDSCPSSTKENKNNRSRCLRQEKNRWSKITPEQVKKIREMHQNNFSYKELSQLFNVTKTAIQYIVTRKTWKHII